MRSLHIQYPEKKEDVLLMSNERCSLGSDAVVLPCAALQFAAWQTLCAGDDLPGAAVCWLRDEIIVVVEGLVFAWVANLGHIDERSRELNQGCRVQ